MENKLSQTAEALNWPTQGEFAEKLWRLLSTHRSPFGYEEAAKIYRACGYIPFCGYPLSRSGKIPSMSREECLAVLTEV